MDVMKSLISVLCILFIGSVSYGSNIGTNDFVISENGSSKAVIVIGKDATITEKFAAEELKKYIKAICGAELKISQNETHDELLYAIVIGTPNTNKYINKMQSEEYIRSFSDDYLGYDGYIIKTVIYHNKNAVVLAGNKPRAALFAVYGFLEECLGVRFFGFDTSGEIIPKHATIKVADTDICRKPKFKFRISNNNNFLQTDREMLTKIIDWNVKNRFNVFMLQLDKDVNNSAFDEFTKRGMELWGGCHIWGKFTPSKELFASHPEYFPLIDNKRAFTGDKYAISFCYSNPEAMKIFVDNAVAYARGCSNLDVFACWQEDGPNYWAQCRCENCRKFTFSDWNITIINEIRKAFDADPMLRNVRLQAIAYGGGSIPPVHVVPYNNGKNIDLFYTNGARENLAPMDSSLNRKPAEWLLGDPERMLINTEFKQNPTNDDLAAFQRLKAILNYLNKADFKGNISLLEFVNAHIGYWLDLPYMENVQTGPWSDDVFIKDMQFYLENGITGWSNCYDWPNDSPDPFFNRLMAQILWDPYADVENIKKDFYDNYYGAAGSKIQKYYEKMWNLLAKKKPKEGDYDKLKSLYADLLKAGEEIGTDDIKKKHFTAAVKWHDSLRLLKPSTNAIEDGSFEQMKLQDNNTIALSNTTTQMLTGKWFLVHPPASSAIQAPNGNNYVRSSDSNCTYKKISSDYVYEADTFYKFELDVLPLNEKIGSIELIAKTSKSHKELVLVTKQLVGLKKEQWNHITLEWTCKSGSTEEGLYIGVACRHFNNTAIDGIILKAPSIGVKKKNDITLTKKLSSDSYQVVCHRSPIGKVNIDVSCDSNVVIIDTAKNLKLNLVFDEDNWPQPQTITVKAKTNAFDGVPKIANISNYLECDCRDAAFIAIPSVQISVR